MDNSTFIFFIFFEYFPKCFGLRKLSMLCNSGGFGCWSHCFEDCFGCGGDGGIGSCGDCGCVWGGGLSW